MANADIGETAPDFTLDSTEGKMTLSSKLRDGAVLLVFYPGDNTPVCTKQLCNYRDNMDAFADLGIQVFGINPQSLKSHQKFTEKHEFPFPLLSDPKGVVCKQYGAAGLMGGAKRALVLIDKNGKVKWRKTDIPIFHQSANDIRKALAEL